MDTNKYTTTKPSERRIAIRPDRDTDRYLMHQVHLVRVGKRTQFINMETVAKELQIPESYIPVYIGYEVGARVREDKQGWIVEAQGDFSPFIAALINKFVMCEVCKLPELSYKKGVAICRSCGHRARISKMVPEKFAKHTKAHPPVVPQKKVNTIGNGLMLPSEMNEGFEF